MTTLFNPACGSCSCSAGAEIYASGAFFASGTNTRQGVCRLDASGVVTSFVADMGIADNVILAVVYDSANGYVYLAGDFSTINGTARNGLARVDATTGAIDSWNPNPNGTVVYDILLHNSLIYFVGDFTTVGATGRNRAACVDSSGVLQAWDPNLSAVGEALAVSGSTIYIGGLFTTVGGTARNAIAAVDDSAGTLTAWDPNLYAGDLGSPPGSFPAETYSLLLSSAGVLYAGGYFSHVGGAAGTARAWAAAIDLTTGAATAWDAALDDIPWQFAEDASGNILMAGDFNNVHSTTRNQAAMVDTSGALLPPDFGFGAAGFGRAVLIDASGNLYVGGSLREADNSTRIYLVKFDANGVRDYNYVPAFDAEPYDLAEVA